MANTKPKTQDRSLNMKVDGEFLEALERVRLSEKPARTKSDCIRRLVFDADKRLRRR